MSLPTPYFEADGLTIYNADCKTILPFLGHFDLLLTDPPYGLGKKWTGGTWFQKNVYENDNVEWDAATPSIWLIKQIIKMADVQIIWGGNYFELAPSRCWLSWTKRDNMPTMADFELAWTNIDKPCKEFHTSRSGFKRTHPTEKPLNLIQWAIQQAPDDCKTILDPFMGSGTTLVAARALGRQAVGIEREERYCEAAVNRLRQLVLF